MIELEGVNGVTLDFTGVELRGQLADADIDEAEGFGLSLNNCRDVEIRGGVFGGYRACILAKNCEGITIDGARFDGWFGQRLRSTAYAEDLSDWLRPHHADEGEWVRDYGGAISFTDSQRVTVRGCRGRRGQNGILLVGVEGAKIYDNDFSFLSGWGLALFRASDNVISHNVFDYCVRGYSHDVYWRGQDSAGILLFEQSSRNLVARNSATHCGDGVFLYAGHDLVEHGRAGATGSNENIFFGNDLRFSVANSLEATFSDLNAVIDNDLSGSHQHGIWGGYSSRMAVVGNRIENTRGPAITIEHGQDCIIADNEIVGNEVGFQAYWDEDPQFVDGPYGRVRSTESSGHWVIGNRFVNNVLDLVVRRTRGLIFHANEYTPGTREAYFVDMAAETDPTVDAQTVQRWLDATDGAYPSGNLDRSTLDPWTGRGPDRLNAWRAYELPSVPGSKEHRAEKRDEFKGGLDTIVMGEFGPWDIRAGGPRPEIRRSGGLLEDATWRATWFHWSPTDADPRTAERTWRSRATAPILTQDVETFINPWGSEEIKRRVGSEFFGLFAQTEFTVAEGGTFDLSTVSDDGVRVYLDEELLIDNWSLHGAERDEKTVVLEAGEHVIRLEYFQIQGAAALVVDLSPH